MRIAQAVPSSILNLLLFLQRKLERGENSIDVGDGLARHTRPRMERARIPELVPQKRQHRLERRLRQRRRRTTVATSLREARLRLGGYA